jgi:hypothetical protein
MSVDQEEVVDAIADDKDSDKVLMFIMDHLPWDKSVEQHAHKLREKINGYLSFVESGELVRSRPSAKDRKVAIRVIGKYPLNETAEKFYKLAAEKLSEVGFELKFDLTEKRE